MNRTILVIAGLAIAGGIAANTQEQEDQPFNPNRDVTSEPQSTTATEAPDPESSVSGLSAMTAGELTGMKVVTLTGEEIGEISDVGKSPDHAERIATIDVGGFIGVGEKKIAIPLSELHPSVTEEGSVRTSMSRASIESQPQFDDAGFTPE